MPVISVAPVPGVPGVEEIELLRRYYRGLDALGRRRYTKPRLVVLWRDATTKRFVAKGWAQVQAHLEYESPRGKNHNIYLDGTTSQKRKGTEEDQLDDLQQDLWNFIANNFREEIAEMCEYSREVVGIEEGEEIEASVSYRYTETQNWRHLP